MIFYIKGKVKIKKDNFVLLERQGIGFKIFTSQETQEKIKEGEEKEFYTYFCIRNDKPEIYGFLTLKELEVFEAIEKISGIGVKGALLVASIGSIEELKKAVETRDFRYFSKIKGIGRKKVQKIILELGGSLKEAQKEPTALAIGDKEALMGLMALGFSSKEAREALREVPEEIRGPERRIQKALQFLSRNG